MIRTLSLPNPVSFLHKEEFQKSFLSSDEICSSLQICSPKGLPYQKLTYFEIPQISPSNNEILSTYLKKDVVHPELNAKNNEEITWWQWPILILLSPLLLSGCDDSSESVSPIKPENLEDGSYPKTEDADVDALPEPPDASPSCFPDVCTNGFIDQARSSHTLDACLAFRETTHDAHIDNLNLATGVKIIDVDQDGHSDLFILNKNSPNQFFRNEGGVFVNRSEELDLDFGGDSTDAAFIDYDQDGDLDLFLTGHNGNSLFKRNENSWQEVLHDPEPGTAVIWFSGGFYLGTENGTRFYKYLGNDQFQEDSVASKLDDPGQAAQLAVADYDGDGKEDMYVANLTGRSRLFKNHGDGTFESVEDITQTLSLENTTSAQWIRFNEEERPSLYVTRFNGANHLFVNQGNDVFQDQAPSLGLQDPGSTSSQSWGDFLNEGKPAVYLGRWDQENLLYIPTIENGEIIRYENRAQALGLATNEKTLSTHWVDYDEDGLLDLLMLMADGGFKLYHNESKMIDLCR